MTNWFPNWRTKQPRLRLRSPRNDYYHSTGKQLIRRGYKAATAEEKYMSVAPADASNPERMVYAWLIRNQFDFNFQVSVIGGRAPGGAVLDFVVLTGARLIAIRVQSYWHTMSSAQMNDDIQLAKLTELGYTVVDLWEQDILTVEGVNEKMNWAIYGR